MEETIEQLRAMEARNRGVDSIGDLIADSARIHLNQPSRPRT